LGRYIASQAGVSSFGATNTLFYFENNEVVHRVGVAIKATDQFRRWSAVTALAAARAPSPSPIKFYQLEKMNGIARLLSGFTEV
jgi:hypothetical protein